LQRISIISRSLVALFGDMLSANMMRTPLLLLIHMPTHAKGPDAHQGFGFTRVKVLLHDLKYKCALRPLNIRMVVMVQPGELGGCVPLCGKHCTCVEAQHSREFMQRNIAAHLTGMEDVFYAHADMWINLNLLTSMLDAGAADYTLLPRNMPCFTVRSGSLSVVSPLGATSPVSAPPPTPLAGRRRARPNRQVVLGLQLQDVVRQRRARPRAHAWHHKVLPRMGANRPTASSP